MPPPTPPNVILIMTDQQRADSLGCTGNPVVQTPQIDALAARGAVFRNHFTPHQICSPSRSTLFSGLFARHPGLTRNGVALPQDLPLITHDLKAAGYRTHGAGKFHFQPILAGAEHEMPDSNAFWDLPQSAGWTGPFYGFDSVDILIGESVSATEGGHYANWLRETAPEAAALYLPENALEQPPEDMDEVWKSAIPAELHYNSWITDRACHFLQNQTGDAPFFLFVSYPDPHHPFSPPAPWCDMYDPAEVPAPAQVPDELAAMPSYILDNDREEAASSYVDFLRNPGPPREQGFMQTTKRFSDASLRQAIAHTYGMVSMIDDGIGRILAQLDAQGLTGDTLIIFTSDHGELLGDHGLIRKGPSPYRPLLHVPLIMAGPGVAPGERNGITSHLDLRATLQDHLALPQQNTDGKSFQPMLPAPETPGRETFYAEYHPRTRMDTYNQTLLSADWRFTLYPENPDWGEMFHLASDPGEHVNLYFHPDYTKQKQQFTEQLTREFPPASQAGGPSLATY
ncbi:sulfatase family protein [Leisingera sp. ANG-Vp]|uniref:sulfatase family protein n=1 Tax=Leisingera sp. ANG-Vp TaxID=1577896 RepID=UPI00057C497C|nr:sulfatase-like hydrolase/transferase [Leisingera sp. ANG-Vp]KIC22794.1 arylsulfatase [Leisingera sp. ANG-Vp]